MRNLCTRRSRFLYVYNKNKDKMSTHVEECPQHLEPAPRRHPYLEYNSKGEITAIDAVKIFEEGGGTGDIEDKMRGAAKFLDQVKDGKPDYCMCLDDAVKHDGEKCDKYYAPDTLKLCANTGSWDEWDIGVPGECHSTNTACHEVDHCHSDDVARRPAYSPCEDLHLPPPHTSADCNFYYGKADAESHISPLCEIDPDPDDANYPCRAQGHLPHHGCYDSCANSLSRIKKICEDSFGNNMDAFANLTPEDRFDRCTTCIRRNAELVDQYGAHCSASAKEHVHLCHDLILKGLNGEQCNKDSECQSGNCKLQRYDPNWHVNRCPGSCPAQRQAECSYNYGWPDCDQACEIHDFTLGHTVDTCHAVNVCLPAGH